MLQSLYKKKKEKGGRVNDFNFKNLIIVYQSKIKKKSFVSTYMFKLVLYYIAI